MSEELQGLLERIRDQGLKKAEGERESIVLKARDEAKAIVKKAEDEAANIRKQAEVDARRDEEKAKAAIQQAARDILLVLENELSTRLRNCVTGLVDQAMTPALMAELIRKMAAAYAANTSQELSLELILNQKDLEQVAEQLRAALVNDLKTTPTVLASQDMGGGIKVGFKGSDVFLDFSDNALAASICAFVGQKIATVIKGK